MLHLKNRVPPMERLELKELTNRIKDNVLNKVRDVTINSEEEKNLLEQSIKDKVLFRLKKKVYNWKPINYDDYTSLKYLIGRFAPEYAVLTKICTEIKVRDEDFKPRSFIDFGSGVGTAMW